MEWLSFLPIVLLFAVGLGIYVLMMRYEAAHLRYAWDFLAEPEEDEDRTQKRETLFARLGMTLSAARLIRLTALLLVIPSLVYILELYLLPSEALAEEEFTPSQSILGMIVLASILVFLFAIGQSRFLRHFHETRTNPERSDADWMSDSTQPVPAPIAAAALMWDWIVRRCEGITSSLKLERPRAYLIEREDELLMAVGETEMSAFGLKRNGASKAMTPNERTEMTMVRAIQRLDQTLVREVMRPLNKVTAIHIPSYTPEKFLGTARRTGYTRLPCYYDQMTNLIGYLNVHDFLETPVMPKDFRSHIHEALYIPEVARVDAALEEMLKKKRQIAICFDEFGGCSGLLSREDIIEEITGEIMDEYDRPEELKWEERRGDFLVDASIDLDDLAESVGLDVEKWNCDTLAGYIYHRLSRVPRRGEVLEEHGWILEVVHMDKHRIQKVRIVPPPEYERNEDSDDGD